MVGYVALVLISTLFSIAAVVATPTGRRRAIVVGLPALFVLAEWARDRFPLQGFPLAGAALGQASGPLTPTVRLGGSLLLTAELVLVGVAAAEIVHAVRGWRDLRSPWRATSADARSARSTAVGAAVVVAVTLVLPIAGRWAPAGVRSWGLTCAQRWSKGEARGEPGPSTPTRQSCSKST